MVSIETFRAAGRRVLRAQAPRLWNLPGVVGAGIGLRERGGSLTAEPAIIVFVVEKLPAEVLPLSARVPERVQGLRTDVIPIGVPRALAARPAEAPVDPRQERVRPAPGGVSIGHFRDGSGTLGALVRDRRSGALLILSNNHVLANTATARDGRTVLGDPILQPGPADGGTAADAIARLERFVPLELVRDAAFARAARLGAAVRPLAAALQWTPGSNRVDAAVAAPLEPSLVVPEILGIGLPRSPRPAEPGLDVMKSGRTTGVTRGRIRAVDASVRVEMEPGWVGVFHDQIVTTPMAAPGDSGSLLVDGDGHAVGMISAGSSQASIANPIGPVLEALDVELVTA